MPVFKNFDDDPVVPLLQDIRNGINNMGASFGSSLGNLEKLNLEFPTFSFSEIKSLELLENIPTPIVEREDKVRRSTIKNSQKSTGVILLIQGQDNPVPEDFLKTPWVLQPGSMRIDDRDGGYPVWAMALGGNAKVELGIEYADNFTKKEVKMKINPSFGTGENWSYNSEWYKSKNGPTDYESQLNSSATGFKLFSFSSFNPGEEYTFTLNPGGMNYKNSRAYPINVYLFDFGSLSRSLFFTLMNLYSSLNLEELKKILPILKEKSWAARLPSLGGQFKLKPRNDRYVGLIDIAIAEAVYAETAVFKFTQSDNTGTFEIIGV